MEVVSWVSTAIWVAIFVLTMLIYSPHLSFKFTCTLSTHRLLTGPFVNPFIFTVAFMLNFLWLLVKWMRWYFSGINITPYQYAQAVYTLCALFKALWFSFMVLLYVSILELSINPNAEVVPFCSSSKSVQAKNKNRISNSAELWGISVFVYIVWAI